MVIYNVKMWAYMTLVTLLTLDVTPALWCCLICLTCPDLSFHIFELVQLLTMWTNGQKYSQTNFY